MYRHDVKQAWIEANRKGFFEFEGKGLYIEKWADLKDRMTHTAEELVEALDKGVHPDTGTPFFYYANRQQFEEELAILESDPDDDDLFLTTDNAETPQALTDLEDLMDVLVDIIEDPEGIAYGVITDWDNQIWIDWYKSYGDAVSKARFSSIHNKRTKYTIISSFDKKATEDLDGYDEDFGYYLNGTWRME